jgi:hypothetical protein
MVVTPTIAGIPTLIGTILFLPLAFILPVIAVILTPIGGMDQAATVIGIMDITTIPGMVTQTITTIIQTAMEIQTKGRRPKTPIIILSSASSLQRLIIRKFVKADVHKNQYCRQRAHRYPRPNIRPLLILPQLRWHPKAHPLRKDRIAIKTRTPILSEPTPIPNWKKAKGDEEFLCV